MGLTNVPRVEPRQPFSFHESISFASGTVRNGVRTANQANQTGREGPPILSVQIVPYGHHMFARSTPPVGVFTLASPPKLCCVSRNQDNMVMPAFGCLSFDSLGTKTGDLALLNSSSKVENPRITRRWSTVCVRWQGWTAGTSSRTALSPTGMNQLDEVHDRALCFSQQPDASTLSREGSQKLCCLHSTHPCSS